MKTTLMLMALALVTFSGCIDDAEQFDSVAAHGDADDVLMQSEGSAQAEASGSNETSNQTSADNTTTSDDDNSTADNETSDQQDEPPATDDVVDYDPCDGLIIGGLTINDRGHKSYIEVTVCNQDGEILYQEQITCGTVCADTALVCTHPETDDHGRHRLAVGYYYGQQANPTDCNGAQFVVYTPWTPRIV